MDVARALRVGTKAVSYLGTLASEPRRLKSLTKRMLDSVESYDRSLLDPPNLPERPLHETLPGIEGLDVCLRHKLEPKGLPYGEAYVLAAMTRYLAPRTVFEIGTFAGASTLLMAQHAGPACRLYTLDVPPGHDQLALAGKEEDPPEADAARIGERFHGTEEASQITQLYGDSATFDFSPYAGQMDLVFVDGSHSYDYVRNDTRRALEMLSPSGTIVWDDCSREDPGVVKALDGFGASIPIHRIVGSRFALHTRMSVRPAGDHSNPLLNQAERIGRN